MNSTVRSVLLDLGGQRKRPDDPGELVFACRHAQADKFFPKAVEQAQKALRDVVRIPADSKASRGMGTGTPSPHG
jgi:hypothetical protein